MAEGEIIELTDETFDQTVKECSRIVLVDFRTGWCKQCARIHGHLMELADEESERVVVATLNVDDNEEVPYRFGIRSVPTLILFSQGKMVDQMVGAAPKEEIRRMISRTP
jgi:thioredoxin 1